MPISPAHALQADSVASVPPTTSMTDLYLLRQASGPISQSAWQAL
ncbi:hypothetical protein Q0M94_11715 [Deinococcus radiomollis]